ncbi:MAG: hypothetical protein LBT14_13650 [Treponema sp.]|jgi:hypothetical protein|nr:hypothetical protein [Treponema sp.]
MTIEQTIEIPANGWIHLDIPPEWAGASGKVVINALSPVVEAEAVPRHRLTEGQRAAIEECCSLAKRMGCTATSDDFLEQRCKDKELEDRLDARHFRESLNKMCLNRSVFENPSTEPLEPLLGIAEGSAFTVERLLEERRAEEKRDLWTTPSTLAL